jgi:anti-sigma28 factor (negative regulator of flagellin synthesis)
VLLHESGSSQEGETETLSYNSFFPSTTMPPKASATPAQPRPTSSTASRATRSQGQKTGTSAVTVAKVSKAKKSAETQAKKKAVQQRIAEIEDEIHDEDAQRKRHAARPDLANKVSFGRS